MGLFSKKNDKKGKKPPAQPDYWRVTWVAKHGESSTASAVQGAASRIKPGPATIPSETGNYIRRDPVKPAGNGYHHYETLATGVYKVLPFHQSADWYESPRGHFSSRHRESCMCQNEDCDTD